MEFALETKGLTKTYKRGKIQALKALDLQVPKGCAFGLLGPNGAGKSTLVKTLLGIVSATSGSATLLGEDFRRVESRRSVGYLPEGHRFPSYLTGRTLCNYFGRLSGLRGDTLTREIDEKLELVGMKEWADTKVSKYSKGMAQRVGLAQAMLGNPKLLLLDEPTDGVDPVGRMELRKVIQRQREKGVTVFFNSHLLSEVEQVCDRVAIMHHGLILHQGTVRELITNITGGQGTLHVRFRVSRVDESLAAKISGFGPWGPVEGGFMITLQNANAITAVVDMLREQKVEIFAIEPQHANLEEAFIQLISRQADKSVGGTH
jgi:ABC-2 type transport system ATP-binding protein